VIQQVQAVRKWGNSRAVVITRRVQRQLSWSLREVVHVCVEGDAIVLRPVRVTVGQQLTVVAETKRRAG
jgi:antitoxin component of MazEF toxin-antitoxin module